MVYEIIIKGYIKDHYFETLEMTQLEDFTTKLSGVFEDQAALYGVLRRIQDLGIELIAVNPVISGQLV
jgi:hypothetical protein